MAGPQGKTRTPNFKLPPGAPAAASWPANPFWDFSLSLYAEEGVAPACLALQDRLGLDVNVLLFCCWLGFSRWGALNAASLAGIVASVEAWQDEVVGPLRKLRVALKTRPPGAPGEQSENLRERIKSCELEAERIEQLMLRAALPAGTAGGGRQDDARANVDAYFSAIGATPGAVEHAHIETLLKACAGLRAATSGA